MIDALPLLLGPEGYQISRSVRLRSSASAYFNRTMAPAGVTVYTFSAWVKRGELGTIKPIVQGYLNNNNYGHIIFKADNTIEWREVSVAANYGQVNTNAVFRDPSAWYHIVVVRNGTSLLIYVNGVSQTLTVSTAVNAAAGYLFGGSTEQRIGRDQVNSAFFDGYLTECYLIDGQALTPTSFGETNAVTGVWQPKKYAGTYGTNGFYLNFSDNSAATAAAIGKDYSGNGNNWTPNNISVTAGVTYDSMLDVPTQWADGGNGRGNYAVLNPLDVAPTEGSGRAQILDGNLRLVGGNQFARGWLLPTSGQWYWEITLLDAYLSIYWGAHGISSGIYGNVTGVNVLADPTGGIMQNGTKVQTFSTWANNDVIGLAYDASTRSMSVYRNGTQLGTAVTANATDKYIYSYLNGTADTSSVGYNFGQRPFAYTPPTGFKALNTLNLPTPTILKGNQYFNAVLYSGNSGSQSITGVGFQPDLVWGKSRNIAENNGLFDAVRGVNKILYSNLTNAEATDPGVSAFNADGFSLNGATINATGYTYVAWNWKEGATQGFDIVTYTGNGTSQNISHSLGVAPKMIVVKNRSIVQNWRVAHTGLVNMSGYHINLDATAAQVNSGSLVWNNTAPTSSVFSVGSDSSVNGNGNNLVAYLFAEVAGFSKFGSYTGNGSTDGPFVFCGFRPRFIMIKRTDSTADWHILDTARDTYNVAGNVLYPNLSAAESGVVWTDDILSNGFKIRITGAAENASGGTYIFAAFAENPFKNALAR